MAALTLKVGQQTATVNTTDAKAARLLDLYIQARYPLEPLPRLGENGPEAIPLDELSNAQRLDWIVQHLARHVAEVARGRHQVTVRQAADEAARAEVNALAW